MEARAETRNELTDASELLEDVIKALVDEPDAVHIDTHVTPHTAMFEVHVHDDDVGKILGRKGAHAKALRVLFDAIYGKLGKRLHLQVVDPRR
jgi:predicted RNA-binding protein YlqC (UPF0109 family)